MNWRSKVIPLLMAGGCCAAEPARFDPTTKYETREIEGWTVLVNRDLFAEEGDLAAKTLRELEFQLYQVTRAVPEEALTKLREVRIWVEAKGPVTCMCYHPSEKWLRDNGFNPEKAKGIELGNPRNFLSWTRHQFWMVFHELAHAYHDQVLGWDDANVRTAYDKAKEEGLYESILVHSGRKGKAYAMNDHKEYFAELSEAFFGCNDWFPFVRAELKELDPLGHDTIQRAWGVQRKQ